MIFVGTGHSRGGDGTDRLEARQAHRTRRRSSPSGGGAAPDLSRASGSRKYLANGAESQQSRHRQDGHAWSRSSKDDPPPSESRMSAVGTALKTCLFRSQSGPSDDTVQANSGCLSDNSAMSWLAGRRHARRAPSRQRAPFVAQSV